jgi:V/A-type H+/Na+-transporting ATPase subunit K
MEFFLSIGFVSALFFPAIGSVLGASAAGMAGIAAMKKCFVRGESAPFILIAFVGIPLSQIIYGMILMNAIIKAGGKITPVTGLLAGVLGGIAIGLSAIYTGKAGALAADAMGETGKGFGFYIMVMGILETAGLFVMVFLMAVLK